MQSNFTKDFMFSPSNARRLNCRVKFSLSSSEANVCSPMDLRLITMCARGVPKPSTSHCMPSAPGTRQPCGLSSRRGPTLR